MELFRFYIDIDDTLSYVYARHPTDDDLWAITLLTDGRVIQDVVNQLSEPAELLISNKQRRSFVIFIFTKGVRGGES